MLWFLKFVKLNSHDLFITKIVRYNFCWVIIFGKFENYFRWLKLMKFLYLFSIKFCKTRAAYFYSNRKICSQKKTITVELHLINLKYKIAIYSLHQEYLLSTTITATTYMYFVLLRKSVRCRSDYKKLETARWMLCAINWSNGTRSETIKPAVRSPDI